MPFKTVANLLAKGASLFAPPDVAITATSTGAVTTAPGTLSGSFVVQPGGAARYDAMIVNGELGYQQVVVSVNGNLTNPSGTFTVQCTNNPASGLWQVPQYVYRQSSSGGPSGVFFSPISAIGISNGLATSFVCGISGFAYVRVSVTGVSAPVSCTWTASTSPFTPVVLTPSITSGIASADGATAASTNDMVIAGNAINSSGSYVLGQQPALTALTWVGLRTPSIFRGAQFSAAGANTIWAPASTKKVRLMKYKIEVSADATVTGGAAPINLQFAPAISTGSGVTAPINALGYTHRVLVPGSSASSFLGYDSGWIDLGNGALSVTAGMPLTMGIQVPQSTAAITSPTWTIAANQWEAATVGFKSAGNLGNIKLVNQASSIALSFATNTVQGNAVFLFFRTVNSASGTPVITVADTALNSYTVLSLVTNASDGTNGSSMGLAYCINAIGAAANTVTVTATNAPSSIESLYNEYSGLGSAGIDAAQVSATGNSTSPASGAYTPATVGDLVFTFMGTSANLAAVPTTPAAFRFIGNDRQAAFGTMAVADNFGNGSLATGVINVIACGTEE
jgi:hypothetical protein